MSKAEQTAEETVTNGNKNPEYIKVPFSMEQIQSMNAYQNYGCFHNFTCGTEDCRASLVATEEGWICPKCSYRQGWCHAWMSNWDWLVNTLLVCPTISTDKFPASVVEKARRVLSEGLE